MREILFRGKRLDNGKWNYGSYLFLHVPYCDHTGNSRGPAKDIHFIIDHNDINYAVDPATIGQYTGMKDRNKERLFEGDIIRFKTWKDGTLCWTGVISFDYCSFIVKGGPNKESHCPFELQMSGINDTWCERIGNIHDSPGLLKLVGGEYGPK